MSKYGHRTGNWLESIVNKLGGEEAGEAFLRDELTVVRSEPKWREEGGIIYFSVTSDGTTGEAWTPRLEAKSFKVSDYAKQRLRHAEFQPTSGITTQVAVLKGELFAEVERTTENIHFFATKRSLTKPNAEVACLIREKFSDKELEEMGLWAIIAMHDPINDSGGDPSLLGADRDDGGRHLYADYVSPSYGWLRDFGFAFAVSQSPST